MPPAPSVCFSPQFQPQPDGQRCNVWVSPVPVGEPAVMAFQLMLPYGLNLWPLPCCHYALACTASVSILDPLHRSTAAAARANAGRPTSVSSRCVADCCTSWGGSWCTAELWKACSPASAACSSGCSPRHHAGNHTTGECWLKYQAGWDNVVDRQRTNLAVNRRGPFSDDFRNEHRTAPGAPRGEGGGGRRKVAGQVGAALDLLMLLLGELGMRQWSTTHDGASPVPHLLAEAVQWTAGVIPSGG